ncbi:MAG: 26S protease regulatory subunit [Planctomycetota bacterium]
MALGGMEFYEQEYTKHLEAAATANEEGDPAAQRKNLVKAVDFLAKLAAGSQGLVKKNRLELAERLLEKIDSIPKDAKPRPGSIADTRERAKQGLPPKVGSPESGGPAKAAEGNNKEDGDGKFAAVERPTTRFDDIAGLEDVKEEIRLKMIYPFKHPEAASRYRIKKGGGILFWGPPGTGKTMLARAVAGEIDAAFYTVKPSEIMSKWVGDSEGNIQKLFAEARKNERSIVFIDEIEALVPKRREAGAGSNVMGRVVPQILAELEGFDSDKKNPLLFLGATNEPWSLDPAVMRPGRFDEKVYIGLPDLAARRKLVDLNLRGRPLEGVDLDVLAEKTQGLSGADVKNICEKAAADAFLRAVRAQPDSGVLVEGPPISMDDILRVLTKCKPSVTPEDLVRFERWGAGKDQG